MNDEPIRLSPAGAARRDQILTDALNHARRRRIRRRTAPVAIVSLLLVAVGVTAGLVGSSRQEPQRDVVRSDRPIVTPSPAFAVTIIRSDPAITERYVARPNPSLVTIVNDDELLAILAEAGRPAEIAYVDGKPMLLFRDRVDRLP